MRRFDPDLWSAVYGTMICAAVGLPVLVVGARGGDLVTVPVAVWWLLFGGYVLTQTLCTWLDHRFGRPAIRGFLAAQVIIGAALALTAPRAGWTSILLIYTAALSVYVVSWPLTLAVIGLNTAVAMAAAGLGGQSAAAVAVTGVLYLLLQVASALGVLGQRRAEESNRRLSAAHTELRAAGVLLAESSRADERLRIARELHDLLGHQLTVLTLELETATHRADPAEHVARANQVARALLADVRATMGELRRRAPDLRGTLERIVADLPAPAVHLSIGADVRTDEARTAALIRCVQEVVTNAIRHAHATELWIDIRTGDDGGIRFEAHDDGPGAARVVMGNGLTGIVERVRELGGHARFDGRTGFRVTAEVPAP
ncbi:signal transduction histidine kinase [Catenuloplanes nepalensis]|uniref:Signal transduction histidine kinase n=1 Tax=Catenuloplanes nepalensis TaxID=587533 RepID=A0ABT9MQV6_9ACTN|nr:histidine kinase [Catenuloplanes nepalensis]MDP9793681.1 signal transduction histidine kinase [Catenuloplanes nepalensis]